MGLLNVGGEREERMILSLCFSPTQPNLEEKLKDGDSNRELAVPNCML